MKKCRWCHTRARLFPSSCHLTSFPSQAVLKPPSKKDAAVNVVRCGLTRCGKTKQLKIVLYNIPNSHYLITHLMAQFQVSSILFVLDICFRFSFLFLFLFLLFLFLLFLFLFFGCIFQMSFIRDFCTNPSTKEWGIICPDTAS